MNTLDLLSIHECDIDITVERIEDVFNELKLNIDDLEEQTMRSLVGQTITEDFGHQIIAELLETAKNMLLEQIAPYEPEIEIYVNGMDSRFDISESDKDIIKATKNTYACDYEYVKWLYEQVPFYQDFKGFIENNPMYHKALQYLIENKINLVWDEPDLDTDPEKLEEAYLADPYNLDKVYLLGASGRYYTRGK